MLDTAVRINLHLNTGPMLVCCKLMVLAGFSGQANHYSAARGVARMWGEPFEIWLKQITSNSIG